LLANSETGKGSLGAAVMGAEVHPGRLERLSGALLTVLRG